MIRLYESVGFNHIDANRMIPSLCKGRRGLASFSGLPRKHGLRTIRVEPRSFASTGVTSCSRTGSPALEEQFDHLSSSPTTCPSPMVSST
jgi:hypothetical protein